MVAFTFSTQGINPSFGGGYDVFEGEMDVIVHSMDIVDAKTGSGKLLKVEFKVVEGEHAGKVAQNNYNIGSSSPDAARIAGEQFTGLLHAIGLPNGIQRDTSEAVGKRLRAKFVIEEYETRDGRGQVNGKSKATRLKQVFMGAGHQPQAQPNSQPQMHQPQPDQGNQQPAQGNGWQQPAQNGTGGPGGAWQQPAQMPTVQWQPPQGGQQPQGGQPGPAWGQPR